MNIFNAFDTGFQIVFQNGGGNWQPYKHMWAAYPYSATPLSTLGIEYFFNS